MRYFRGRVFYIILVKEKELFLPIPYPLWVGSKDNQTVRCDECQHEYRKQVINDNAKRYYQKHKQ
jgi:3-oxoacyl-ACP reductase-like protein